MYQVPEIECLKRARPKGLDVLTTRSGDSVTGKVADLQESQAYPEAFGVAVARLFQGIAPTATLESVFGPSPALVHPRSVSTFSLGNPESQGTEMSEFS